LVAVIGLFHLPSSEGNDLLISTAGRAISLMLTLHPHIAANLVLSPLLSPLLDYLPAADMSTGLLYFYALRNHNSVQIEKE
jgi:hypothetical protein